MNDVTLYLVRHGAIALPIKRCFVGQIDVPMSEEGVSQAQALCKWLEQVRFARIISSDLQRAQRTAEMIASDMDCGVEIDRGLREINLGEWDGLSFSEVQQRFPVEFDARGRNIENWRPPGGESFADCRARVMNALHSILQNTRGNVLVVAHAGVNRLILCDFFGVAVAKMHSIGQDYGCLNIIEFSATRTRLKLLNFIPPTEQPIAEVAMARSLETMQEQESN